MRSFATCLLLALVACDPAEPGPFFNDDPADFGPGGKADDPTAVHLAYTSYDVLFTNPVCREYVYDAPVATADGTGTLTAKPKDVYCSHDDLDASGARPESPQHRLVEWVSALGAGDEIFLAYLSFSNRVVGDQLCAAVTRGAKVTMVLDATSPASTALTACGGTVLLRGHTGGIGYAHNKMILINPGADSVRLSFSSGNLSSGAVTHHENWHFIELPRDTFFAQAHVCLMNALLDPVASSTKGKYKDFLNACRAAIPYPEEDDIKAFFVPSRDDAKRATKYLLEPIAQSASVDLGVHRFGHTGLVDALAARLAAGDGFTLRMVADDDLYWLAPLVGTPAKIGNNEWFEADNVERLEGVGTDAFEIRYFQTNPGEHQLHHNKYLIYRDASGAPFAVLCGAANLTKTGFNENFENIYYVRIPAVLAQFDAQFDRVWDGGMATPIGQMPAVDAAAR